jgi:hypothetical protein
MQSKFQLYSIYLAMKLRLYRLIKERKRKIDKQISA